MGTGPSFRYEECYPPIQYTPYWFICIGFITSTFFTAITHMSGHGIWQFLKSCIFCKCNKPIDMAGSNKWTKYPTRINISSAKKYDIATAEKYSYIYGDYYRKYDQSIDSATLTPYYRSASNQSRNNHYFCLRYKQLEKKQYNGWILMVDSELRYKYEMIQANSGLNENVALTINTNSQSQSHKSEQKETVYDALKETPNKPNIDGYPDLKIEENTNNNPLSLLSKEMQIYYVYPWRVEDYGTEFWDTCVQKSQFMNEWVIGRNDEIHYLLTDHLIYISDFSTYQHNVWKDGQLLDINGIYRGTYVNRSMETHAGGRQTFITFDFVQIDYIPNNLQLKQDIDVNNGLSCQIKVEKWVTPIGGIHYSLTGSINHTILGILAEFKSVVDRDNDHSIELLKINTIQHLFDEKHHFAFEFSETKWYSLYFGRAIQILLFLMIVYQFVVDFIFFINISSYKDWSHWQKYGCFGFIVSNSANMKQLAVLLLCMAINDPSFVNRKYRWTVLVFLSLYGIAFVPFAITHTVPFEFVYCWLFIPLLCILYSIEKGITRGKCEGINKASFWTMCFLIGYFLIVLWPVPTMTRFFADEGYIFSLVSFLKERETIDYINKYVDKWKSFTQFWIWIF